jgi:predicted MFS family arabinose efflux permease
VFGTMAVGSFSSGSLLTTYGWDTVLWIAFLPLLIAAATLAWKARTPAPIPEQGPSSSA